MSTPLDDEQWMIRGLMLGPGTVYRLMDRTNPFLLSVRADQSEARPWDHGSWSGAEWANERPVPLQVLIDTDSLQEWLTARHALAAAFAPVGDAADQVELRFVLAGQEFVLFGRPRLIEPDMSLVAYGRAFFECRFAAQDPRIYSGALHTTGAVTLPGFSGGRTVPFTVPFSIDATISGGEATLVNAGNEATGLSVRIDGPVTWPRFTITHPDASTETLQVRVSLADGQWLDIDTRARTVFANGSPAATRRGDAVGAFPLLKPGTSTLSYRAETTDTGTLTATWRDAWL